MSTAGLSEVAAHVEGDGGALRAVRSVAEPECLLDHLLVMVEQLEGRALRRVSGKTRHHASAVTTARTARSAISMYAT